MKSREFRAKASGFVAHGPKQNKKHVGVGSRAHRVDPSAQAINSSLRLCTGIRLGFFLAFSRYYLVLGSLGKGFGEWEQCDSRGVRDRRRHPSNAEQGDFQTLGKDGSGHSPLQ